MSVYDITGSSRRSLVDTARPHMLGARRCPPATAVPFGMERHSQRLYSGEIANAERPRNSGAVLATPRWYTRRGTSRAAGSLPRAQSSLVHTQLGRRTREFPLALREPLEQVARAPVGRLAEEPSLDAAQLAPAPRFSDALQ